MRKLFVVAMMMLVAGCASGGAAPDAEAAAVYEALLEDHCCQDSVIVMDVTDSTAMAAMEKSSREDEQLQGFSPEVKEAVASLYARSRTVQRLPDSLRVTGHDRRLPADSIRAILKRMQDDHLRRLPDSATVVLISAVGFSRDGKLAVVRMTEVCGSLCGGSTMRALRRHPGGWVAAEEVWSVIF
jgi:hypothetical protein